jgi:hypothetical protein
LSQRAIGRSADRFQNRARFAARSGIEIEFHGLGFVCHCAGQFSPKTVNRKAARVLL